MSAELNNLSEGKLVDIVRLLEHDAFINAIVPVLKVREELLFESLLKSNEGSAAEETRGRIREIRHLLLLHDLCMDQIEHLRSSKKTSRNEENG